MSPSLPRAVPAQRPIPARSGIGLRARHHDDLLRQRPDIGWLEAHSENYFADGGAQIDYLLQLRETYPLSLHGVGLSLGSTDALDREHLWRLKRLVHLSEPGLVSEHLCWGSVNGTFANDLLPLPYTEEALRHMIRRVGEIQDFLGRQILIENVSSYLQFECSAIPEWEFLAALAVESGCGVLLDVNHIVTHVEQLLTRLIGEDIELRTYPSDDLWPVKADAAQLEQVLMNLAVNARDAMRDGGLLTIDTANVDLTRSVDGEPFVVVAGPYVLLAVTDTGTGMNAETKARAFEPFFTTKPPGQGTGLGLSMVYGIVKQSGGYIWVDSELGAGTRVRIYLPRADDLPLPLEMPAEDAAESATPTAATDDKPATLLLVEDEDGVRDLIHEWLSGHGFTVWAAEDGHRALTVAEKIEQVPRLC
jgi:hypothetical protein